MQKNLISLMLLVAAVASATLDPTNVIGDAEWIAQEYPMTNRVDPRTRRQVRSTDSNKQESPISTDVKIIDGATLLKDVEAVQTPASATAIRQASTALGLPTDTSLISIDACIFIGLKISIVINVPTPLACRNICAGDSQCTHFTHEALKNGGTCTLHKNPGAGKEWATPVAKSSGATCGHIHKKNCVASDGSLLNINICLELAVKISLGLL